jgi:hypothetical protein
MTYKSVVYMLLAFVLTTAIASTISVLLFPDGIPSAVMIAGGASIYYSSREAWKAGKKKPFVNKEIEGLTASEIEILESE